MRYWLYLAAAIAAEVTGTSLLKWGADTGNLLGLAAMSVLLAFSFYMLSLAVVRVPVGVAYAVWEGIGIIIISIVGYWVFDERLSLAKTLAMLSIIIGITLMKRGTDEGPSSDAPAAGRA
ncbi:multidrug efflux SMR transporter [Laribacter hongkongensis]|uniref:DMT family transporter n=1 Tax=Laribacter hongkongensis TaxID=168471 RepID=UPI001EFDFB26|nr:multidrug efflux SMR transporter [Laribacter hongkongensis]MCG8997281.1 multidrug efflux SMR transporter [Laribacter hongkongensis]MCG9003260.1 multidrug efflux SMR transporter [Laribacter hongkongensis]MCG9013397.1 multidrug efflux SMR transporter [Laribacter hongkongensis]MCG9018853.1 multidrug efflux SMR transporter [Laribacter hongkongensis]MCG9027527.1 multidrug efflux SMR transporter [Laribacter hongkongensis]